MGIGNYFRPKPAPQQVAPPPLPAMEEKAPPRFTDSMEMSQTNTPKFGSSRASIAPSTRSSTYVDEIKHEVMVNYLHQQQCSHLWVSDNSGEMEGVLLKKSRNNYLACPPQLAVSQFAAACAALNCQVSSIFLGMTQKQVLMRNVIGRHDSKFQSNQGVPRVVTRRRGRTFDERSSSPDSAYHR